MGNSSSIYMQNYIREVFEIVIKLYKDVAPELISESFEIDVKDVHSLSSQDIMKKLNNLEIDYKIVEEKDKEQIWYQDSVNQRLMANIVGQEFPSKSDELRLYLNEPEILDKTSVEDIKKARDLTGMSKIISDINFISHEMAHAFDHIIKVENHSYIDSRIYLAKNNENMIDYDIGESFAESMERLILDRLAEEGQLEKYGLDQYATVSDIEDVWNKKRIIPFTKRGVIGKTEDGKNITYLDLDLEIYKFMKENGMKEAVNYIKNLDLFSLYKSIPNKNDLGKIEEFCNNVSKGKYSEFLIPENQNYESVYSNEEILILIRQMQMKNNVKSVQELGKETVLNQKDIQTIDFEENLIAKEEREIKAEIEEQEGNIREGE